MSNLVLNIFMWNPFNLLTRNKNDKVGELYSMNICGASYQETVQNKANSSQKKVYIQTLLNFPWQLIKVSLKFIYQI